MEKIYPNCNREMYVIYGYNAGFGENNNLLATNLKIRRLSEARSYITRV